MWYGNTILILTYVIQNSLFSLYFNTDIRYPKFHFFQTANSPPPNFLIYKQFNSTCTLLNNYISFIKHV